MWLFQMGQRILLLFLSTMSTPHVSNPLIVRPLYYTPEDIRGIYHIFKDEEKRLMEKNPFVFLLEEKGYSHYVLKDFINTVRHHDIKTLGPTFTYEDLFVVEDITESTIKFTNELHDLLYTVDRKGLPKYLNHEALGRFAHWRILTKK